MESKTTASHNFGYPLAGLIAREMIFLYLKARTPAHGYKSILSVLIFYCEGWHGRFKLVLLATILTICPIVASATDFYKAKSDLNVRAGPGTKYPIVYTLHKGDEVEVLVKKGSWYQLKVSGNIGYASSRFLEKTSRASHTEEFDFQILYFLLLFIAIYVFKRWRFEVRRNQRRDYYRNEYLTSPEWQQKRHMVLRRDNWRCVYCGAHATQVHHKRYAKRNIGKEPISWLVSICKTCHESIHH